MRGRRALASAVLSAAVVLGCAGVAHAQPGRADDPGGQSCEHAAAHSQAAAKCAGAGATQPVAVTTTTTVADAVTTSTNTPVVGQAPRVRATTTADDSATAPTDTLGALAQQLAAQQEVGVQQQVGAQQQVGVTTAVDDAATTPKDTPVVIDILANDTTTFAANLVIDGFSDPAHGRVAIVEGGVTGLQYTPNAGFVGTDTFDDRVCATNVVEEAQPCAIAAVTVTVTDTAAASVTTSTTDASTTTTTVAPAPSPTTVASTECGDCAAPLAAPAPVAPSSSTMAVTGGSSEGPLALGLLGLAGGGALVAIAGRRRRARRT